MERQRRKAPASDPSGVKQSSVTRSARRWVLARMPCCPFATEAFCSLAAAVVRPFCLRPFCLGCSLPYFEPRMAVRVPCSPGAYSSLPGPLCSCIWLPSCMFCFPKLEAHPFFLGPELFLIPFCLQSSLGVHSVGHLVASHFPDLHLCVFLTLSRKEVFPKSDNPINYELPS